MHNLVTILKTTDCTLQKGEFYDRRLISQQKKVSQITLMLEIKLSRGFPSHISVAYSPLHDPSLSLLRLHPSFLLSPLLIVPQPYWLFYLAFPLPGYSFPRTPVYFLELKYCLLKGTSLTSLLKIATHSPHPFLIYFFKNFFVSLFRA